jgi:coniferyl-aldehyde dehydrogenase
VALVVNDAMTHVFFDALPFGGFGASGMGHYHGEYGFQALSHANPWYGKARAWCEPDRAV